MKIASNISIVLILVYAVIAVAQLWFEFFSAETFFKLTVTFGIVIVVSVVVALIRREYINDDQMRKDGHID